MTQLDLFDSFQDSLNEAERIYREAEKRYLAAKKLRDDNCKHLEMEKKTYYFSGSYYDTGYTDTWYVCKVCGAKTERTTEHHNWYG